MITSLSTSHDGQWIALRRGRNVTLIATSTSELVANPGPVSEIDLLSDDCDVAFVGPLFAAVLRGSTGDRVMLYEPPFLEAVARHDLDAPARLACVTGPRLALLGLDGKQITIIRVAARSVSTQTLDAPGAVEFAVGLEKNQILLSLLKKLEVWDAVSCRPVLRLQLQLPPPPRITGSAQGHLWAVRADGEEVFVYRLSDGRPFRHYAGAPIKDVICHAASPLLVLATPRGLLRLHCFAHSIAVIDAPWTPGQALAQLAIGEDISLLGIDDEAAEPWRVPISGTGAQLVADTTAAEAPPEPAAPPTSTAADKLRGMRANQQNVIPSAAAAAPPAPVYEPPQRQVAPVRPDWRDQLVALGHALSSGSEPDVPTIAIDNELGDLAHRLRLGGPARRVLTSLYALHLVGDGLLAIARLARASGDWPEALGKGELGALAMLDKSASRVALRRPVTDLLDGIPPRNVRLVGGAPGKPRAGTHRIGRDGRTDAEIESHLAQQLGRIAVVDQLDKLDAAMLEARLHGATAVALAAPSHRPRPWPRDAGLVLVLPGSPSAWLGDLPNLTDATGAVTTDE